MDCRHQTITCAFLQESRQNRARLPTRWQDDPIGLQPWCPSVRTRDENPIDPVDGHDCSWYEPGHCRLLCQSPRQPAPMFP